MRIRLISYSKSGRDTAKRIAGALSAAEHECRRFALPKYCMEGDEPLTVKASAWAEEGFREAEALIFCCASGIAVRAIAPWVRDKTTDPAVIVTDDLGHFVIPLLSGHLGGANELALRIADALGAVPVLTTATDVHGVFAVDVFAKKNHLHISDMALAKAVSAALLSGEKVGFRSELPVFGAMPPGLTEGEAELGIWIPAGQAGTSDSVSSDTSADTGKSPDSREKERKPFKRTLELIPRRYAVGIGCRKGREFSDLSAFVSEQLRACGVRKEEVRCLSSIDLKKEEPGLLRLAESLGVPFMTYTAAELLEAPGEFTASEFVRSVTGVDSVCERAAVLGSACGVLVRRKTAESGMTFALAKQEEGIYFG